MSTSTQAIQHAYNDVVAAHYDLDPQAVTRNSLDRAVAQIRKQQLLRAGAERLKALDLGMGTGLFLGKLKDLSGERIQPFGLDLAANMIEAARRRLPDLVAEVDDAANLDAHFPGQSFDLVSTHFVTGFVPMRVLLPKIRSRLAAGGYWSLVGGTLGAFPALQAKADLKVIRWLTGTGRRKLENVVFNPADLNEVVKTLEAGGFEICEAETFEPKVDFPNFDAFMEFGYTGGWFTPLIEEMGLHEISTFTRWLLNRIFFPVHDHHTIAIVLARKVGN